MEKQKNKRNIVILGIIASFSALAVMYSSVALYFMNHFYFGSTVSCINVEGRTVEEVNQQMPSEIEKYTNF